MAPQFIQFDPQSEAYNQGYQQFGNLDQVFNRAIQMRLQMQQARQQQQAFQMQQQDAMVQRRLQTAQLGFDPYSLSPEDFKMGQQGLGAIARNPDVGGLQQYLQQQKQLRATEVRTKEAAARKTEAEAGFLERGGGKFFGPEQVDAIQSGDLSKLTTVFPGGVPKEAVGLAYSGERITNTEAERQNRDLERTQSRYRNYLLDIEQRDPIIKQLRSQEIGLTQMNALLDLVSEGNTVAAAGMGTKMAKAMGEVGMLTESDIKRYTMSGQLPRKAADTLFKWSKGIPTEATLDEIKQIAKALGNTFQNKIQPRYDKLIKSYATIEKMPPRELALAMGLNYGGKETPISQQGPETIKTLRKGNQTRRAAYVGGKFSRWVD